jgi:RNA recognition motif-containing protein
MTTIYVGNLPFTATEDEVRAIFERHGKVESVKLINDRETGRPRGFAFVDMAAGEAQNAIQQTNGFQMGGRPLRVNEAQERAPRKPGGGQRVVQLPAGTHHISLSCATTSTVAASSAFRFSTLMLVRMEIFSRLSNTLSLMNRLLAPYTWASPFLGC